MTTDATPATDTTVAFDVVLESHRPDRAVPPSRFLGVAAVPLGGLAAGQVRVRNDFLQLTAVMADLMEKDPGLPMPSYKIGEPLWGGAVGTVVESNADSLPVGTVVLHMQGWRTHATGDAGTFWPVAVETLPGAEYVLNQGVTAYHGVVDVARVTENDTVFVSGAAGGVGSLAGQVAKAIGAKRVIGSAGTQEKVDYLINELGFDAAFNYRDGDLQGQLARLAPEGISVFFDTVGGDQFEAAVQAAAPGARFALCGALAGQIGTGDGGHPRLDIMTSIVKQLQILPFSTYHTPEQIAAWNEHYGRWLSQGKIVFSHTLLDLSIKDVPAVLDRLLAGEFRGNVIVRLNSQP